MTSFKKIKNKAELFLAENTSQFYSTITRKIYSQEGKILFEEKQLGKSLVGNFLAILYLNLQNFAIVPGWSYSAPFTGPLYVNNIANTMTLQDVVRSYKADATATITNRGLVIGTGSTPPVAADYALQSIIAHGAGAGQMNYNSMSCANGVVMAGNQTNLVISRTFNNNSGGAITVNEVGLYVLSSTTIMIYRDIIAGGDVVNNSQIYGVDLTFTINT